MKSNWNYSFFALLLLLFTFAACTNEEETTPGQDAETTNEIVVEFIDGALSNSSAGLMYEVNEMAKIADQYSTKSGNDPICNVEQDSSLNYKYAGDLITVDFSGNWTWVVNCNDFFIPTSVAVDASSQSVYFSNRANSNSSRQGDWLIDNLISGPSFDLSGEYTETGNFFIQLEEERSFDATFNFSLNSLLISKTTFEVESGSADFTYQGTSDAGNEISLTGSIEFIGKSKAIITINGNTFEIDLS